MAFPFITEENFEQGTFATTHFDVETDTENKLDFPHYSDLAAIPNLAMPWGGAYCMRIDLAGGTAEAIVREDAAWATAASGTIWFRFMLWVGSDLVMANNDEFFIFQLRSGAAPGTNEGGCVINFTTVNGFRIGIGDASGSSFLPLQLDKWHAVELFYTIDSGAPNDGTLDLWLDGAQATQVTGLDQAAITIGSLGVTGVDAGTTAGTLLFDSVIADDAQIFPPNVRFKEEVLMTRDGHVFVGPGLILNMSLYSGPTTNDNVVSLFDTDVGNVGDASAIKAELKNTATSEIVDPAGMPVRMRRGAYIQMTGDNPRALIQIGGAVAYGSDGAIRAYGSGRKPAPRNV